MTNHRSCTASEDRVEPKPLKRAYDVEADQLCEDAQLRGGCRAEPRRKIQSEAWMSFLCDYVPEADDAGCSSSNLDTCRDLFNLSPKRASKPEATPEMDHFSFSPANELFMSPAPAFAFSAADFSPGALMQGLMSPVILLPPCPSTPLQSMGGGSIANAKRLKYGTSPEFLSHSPNHPVADNRLGGATETSCRISDSPQARACWEEPQEEEISRQPLVLDIDDQGDFIIVFLVLGCLILQRGHF
jgi:hypothetical protein